MTSKTIKAFQALPGYFGGKRKLIPWIQEHLSPILPVSSWNKSVFLDVFAGGGAMSLFAKMHGFQSVFSNDWSNRSQIIFQAVLGNENQYLQDNDLLFLMQPIPGCEPGPIETHWVPHVLSTRHANALDRIFYWANQYQAPTKKSLGLLLLWHLIQEYICMPTSIGSSNRPYAETLDGLRDWQELNPKRFLDNSFPRLLSPRWASTKNIQAKINAGIIGGSPVYGSQQEACEFLKNHSGDIAYLDPPYPGTLSYEQSLKTLDALLMGQPQPSCHSTSEFSQTVDSLIPLLESAHHIPVWVLSYGNHQIDLAGLIQLVQTAANARTVQGYEKAYRHLSHVSQKPHPKELLIIAYS